MDKYKETIELGHNEVPARLNLDTGEFLVASKPEKRGDDTLGPNPIKKFSKRNEMAWEVLETQTSNLEYAVANKLTRYLKMHTNSLDPLNNDTTLTTLSEEFGVSRKSISGVFDRLFRLGVYGKFELYEMNEKYKNYWIFNPYLTSNGKYTKKDVLGLFQNTLYAKI